MQPAFQTKFFLSLAYANRGMPPTWCLPMEAREAVEEFVWTTGASREAAAFAAMGAITAAAQANADIERPGGGFMPLSRLRVVIGEPLTGKSLAIRQFFRATTEVQDVYRELAQGLLEEYKVRDAAWRKTCSILTKQLANAKDARNESLIAAAAELLRAHLETRPVRPRAPQFASTDPSVPGLLGACKRWPWLSVLSTEGQKVLAATIKEGEFTNQMIDGEDYIRHRADRSIEMVGQRISYLLAVHPEFSKDFIKAEARLAMDSGVFPRIDWIRCQVNPSRPKAGLSHPMPKMERFRARLFNRLCHAMPEKIMGGFVRREFRLAPEAEKLWQQYADEVNLLSAPGNVFGNIRATAARSAEKVLRDAGAFHDFSEKSGDLVGIEQVEMAIAWGAWLLCEWLAVVCEPEEPYAVQCGRHLFCFLKRHLIDGGADLVNASDVMHFITPEGMRKAQALNAGIACLEQLNVVAVEYLPGRTKATRKLRLNRALICGPGLA
jgi:hypothetical protein